MKHSPILRASIIITLLAAVVFLLSVFAWRHFVPAIARAEQRQNTEIAAGKPVGDDVVPERPLSVDLGKVDHVGPALLGKTTGQPRPSLSGFEAGSPVTSSLPEEDAAEDAVSVQQNVNNDQERPQVAEHAETSANAGSPPPELLAVPSSKVQLFGTVEFKRPLSSLPGWLDVLKRNKKNPIFVPEKYFKKSVTWDSFKKNAKGKSTMELLRYVNSFWNTWPYIEDITNWKVPDYWSIPAEFIKKSGDCEDYAIVKYFTLKELGIPVEDMRIVVVRDTLRNLAHAVLAVYVNGDAYILDNLSNTVLAHSRIRQYSPQYSVNESGRWAHIKGRKLK